MLIVTVVIGFLAGGIAYIPMVATLVWEQRRHGWTSRLLALAVLMVVGISVLIVLRTNLWSAVGSHGTGPAPLPTPHP